MNLSIAETEQLIHARAPEAGSREAEIVRELEDQVGEERIKEEEKDQNPFQYGVGENERDLVSVSMHHSGKFVRFHG